MTAPRRPIGESTRWFEDFQPGQLFVTHGRTLRDTDAAIWSMFTGDMHPLHVDEVAASTHGLFGGRFPPGLMGIAIASGLWERLGILHGSGLYIDRLTIDYRSPMLIGTTIRMRAEVAAVRRVEGRERGTVHFTYAIVDAADAVCAEGDLDVGVANRPADGVPSIGLVNGSSM